MNDILPIIKLRAIEPEDLDQLYKIENDRKLWNVGNTNVPYSRYVLHEYIANSRNDIYSDRQVRMIIENTHGEAVGIADIVNFDPTHRRAEIGLVIMDAYRRHGYALSAINELISYSRDTLHLHQLYACVDCDNIPSINLFKKAHFVECVILTDWLYDGCDYHDACVMQFFT